MTWEIVLAKNGSLFYLRKDEKTSSYRMDYGRVFLKSLFIEYYKPTNCKQVYFFLWLDAVKSAIRIIIRHCQRNGSYCGIKSNF